MQSAPAAKFTTVEAYFSSLPEQTRGLMSHLRTAIRKAAPDAEEVISYNMPAFRLGGMLVWYAAYKNHIGFYPRSSGIEAFKKELSVYKNAKGSVQFPIDRPLPLALVTRMVKYRVKENKAKAAAKKGNKAARQ